MMTGGGSQLPKPTGTEIDVRAAEFLPSREASEKLRVTWLGHACCFVEFPSGLRALL
jgi:N-acyl-phosphatidylethanolamine-hydrolysing phospholipase D